MTRTSLRINANATESLQSIFRYLRSNVSPAVARRVRSEFAHQFEGIRLHPEAFRIDHRFATDEYAPRSAVLYDYLIIYLYNESSARISILDVVHGASDLPPF